MTDTPVSQADRDNAARVAELLTANHFMARDIAAGDCDRSAVVQAFARHRIQTEATIRAECAGEVAALIKRGEVLSSEILHLRQSLGEADAEIERLRGVLEQIANNNWRDQSRAKTIARAALTKTEATIRAECAGEVAAKDAEIARLKIINRTLRMQRDEARNSAS